MPRFFSPLFLITLLGIPFLNGCLSLNSSSSGGQSFEDPLRTEVDNLKNNSSCYLNNDVQDCIEQYKDVFQKNSEFYNRNSADINAKPYSYMRRLIAYQVEKLNFASKGCELSNEALCTEEDDILYNFIYRFDSVHRNVLPYYLGVSLEELDDRYYNYLRYRCEGTQDALSCRLLSSAWSDFYIMRPKEKDPTMQKFYEKSKFVGSKFNEDKAVEYLYNACLFNYEYCNLVAGLYSDEGTYELKRPKDKNKELAFHSRACNAVPKSQNHFDPAKRQSCIAIGNYQFSKGNKKKAMDCYQTYRNFNPSSKYEDSETLKYGNGYITEKDLDVLRRNYKKEKIIKCEL